jgi:hydroxyacylglutathione hydrolase
MLSTWVTFSPERLPITENIKQLEIDLVMFFKQIVEPHLAQYAYLIGCQRTGAAIIVDPARDIDRYIAIAAENNLKIVAATDTHIHADYLTGLRQFAHYHGIKIYASDEGDADWKYEWLLQSDYDYQLLKDGDSFEIGAIEFKVLFFAVVDHGAGADQPMGLLSGDFVFVGDVGRPDLLESAAGVVGAMEPSARALYHSLQDFKKFPLHWQLWPGHGAGSACGKSLGAVPTSTVGYELDYNPSLQAADNESGFVDYILDGQPEPPLYFARMKRDNRLGPPLLESMPNPAELSLNDLKGLTDQDNVALVDTRNWEEYRAAHFPGAIFAPLGNQLSPVCGSYIEEHTKIYLFVDSLDLPEVILDLIRIGLDDIAGFATLETLNAYLNSGAETSSITEIEVQDYKAKTNTSEFVRLDTRSKAELMRSGAIPGSVNIAHTRLLQRMSELPKNKEIFVHCQAGARSAFASGLLKSKGYNVTYVRGGFDAWVESGAEVAPFTSTLAETHG